MPNKVTIGLWTTFTSWAFDKLLGILQMKNFVIPPTILDIAVCVFGVLTFLGLAMMVWGVIEWAGQTRKQKKIIAKQRDDIVGLEQSLEALRREYNKSYLIDVPNILTDTHHHLMATAEQIGNEEKPNDNVLYEAMQSWATKEGVWIWYKPKKDKINKFFMRLQIMTLLAQLGERLTLLNDALMLSLYKLAGELYDKGLSSKLADAYSKKQAELDKVLQGLGSPDASKHIQRFLMYSYGLSSLFLFMNYTYYNPECSKCVKWLPVKYRTSKASFSEAINIHIIGLRAEVVKQIQLYLVGRA